MHLLVLLLLSADPEKLTIRIDATNPVQRVVVTVNGKACATKKHPELYAAAMKYLAELQPCSGGGTRIGDVTLKGDDVVMTATRGAKRVGPVNAACALFEGPMRIRASSCAQER